MSLRGAGGPFNGEKRTKKRIEERMKGTRNAADAVAKGSNVFIAVLISAAGGFSRAIRADLIRADGFCKFLIPIIGVFNYSVAIFFLD